MPQLCWEGPTGLLYHSCSSPCAQGGVGETVLVSDEPRREVGKITVEPRAQSPLDLLSLGLLLPSSGQVAGVTDQLLCCS